MSGGARPTACVVHATLVGGNSLQTVPTPDGLHAIMVSPYLAGHQVVQWTDMSLAALARSDNMPWHETFDTSTFLRRTSTPPSCPVV
jgi:hypothetical protein